MIMIPDLEFQRYELKFYVDREIYETICDMLVPYMELDPHSRKRNERQYTIRSLYLDNELWDSYYENLDGLKARRKLRIRSYGIKDDNLFLEVKKKVNSSVIKKRENILKDNLPRVLEGEWNADEKVCLFMSNFGFLMNHLKLKPQILVEYEREAYIGIDVPRMRVTFDRNVRAASCSHAMLYPEFTRWVEAIREDIIILELKFDGSMPRFLREIVKELNLSHEPISKYCAGVRVCNLV